MKSLVLFTLLGLMAYAGDPAGLKFDVQNISGHFTLTPPKGHHFNMKAPKFFDYKNKRKNITAGNQSKLTFQLDVRETAEVAITAYLCDDANTYCVKSESKPTVAPSEARAPKVNRYLDKNGFMVNDQDKAFELSKKQGKPLLIDFFAIWCPPCNQYDETVFNTEEFKLKTKKFILLKMDSDHANSWNLKSRYKVGGYPTIIFANQDGDEIFRVVGFYAIGEFLKKADLAYEMRHESYKVLLAKAEKGDAVASEKAGLITLERKDHEQAKKLLEAALMKNPTKESLKVAYRKAELAILDKGFKNDHTKLNELIELIEKDVREFSTYAENETALFVLDSKIRLSDLYDEAKNELKKKEVLTQAEKLIDELSSKLDSKTKQLSGTDLSATDLKEMLLDVQEKMGTEKEKITKTFSDLAAIYAEKAKAAVNSRSVHLEYAYALWKTGFVDKANAIYERFQKDYPKEFTFYYPQAKMYYELKQFEKAKAKALKAYEYSYGDNRLRSAETLAKIEIELGQKKEAKALISKTLAENPKPEDDSVRTTRYLDALSKTLKKIE